MTTTPPTPGPSTPPTPPTPPAAPSASPTFSSSDRFPPTEWMQPEPPSDGMRQKGLLIGLGLAVVVLFMLMRRPAPEAKAARRLVRDFRSVDDVADVREVLGATMPTIARPVLLLALAEIERLVHRGFANAERELRRL